MAGNDAMFTGLPAIVAAYDRMANPVYSVWVGKDMLFSNNSDDNEKAKTLLVENLEAAMQNENRNLLKIKFHPKTEKLYITDKTPTVGTLYVRVCEVYPSLYGSAPGGELIVNRNNGTAAVLEKLSAIESRLTAMEAEEDDDQEEAELSGIGKIDAVTDTINKLCENPVVMGFINKLFNTNNDAKQAPAMALAGVGSKKLEDTLQVLAAADPNIEDDLYLLAVMAQNNPKQFNFLLKTLRNM